MHWWSGWIPAAAESMCGAHAEAVADVVAVFAAGGPSGQLLSQMLNSEALAFQMLNVAGNTRENFSVWDTAKGNQYRFVFPGASLSPDEIEKLAALRWTWPDLVAG
ncbi:MAG: hypothetical protein U1E93_06645 [Alphaproteobacteria bacterium]